MTNTIRKPSSFVQKLLPLLLTVYGGSALAFEQIKFADGTTLDISLQVNYLYMKRINGPTPYQAYPNANAGGVGEILGLAGAAITDIQNLQAIKLQGQYNNTNDGDLSVKKHGTISNRVSGLVEFNLTKEDYRAFLRANTFRDETLFKANGNDDPKGTFNGIGPSNQYSQIARDTIGQRTRVLDAYIQGRWKLGEDGSHPLMVKVGRQVLAWGEGLLFQGIGSSMNPNDASKGQLPGVPFSEAFLPTEQISGTLGLNDKMTLLAYKKWKFRPTEASPVGTYFSPADIQGPGANMMIAVPLGPLGTYAAMRTDDVGVTNKGQWGLGLKYQLDTKTELGLYHLRYTESVGLPEFDFSGNFSLCKNNNTSCAPVPSYTYSAGRITGINDPIAAGLQAVDLLPSSFHLRYMNDIKLTGASISTSLGLYQVSAEIVYRDGAPILMADQHYAIARGKVTNTNLSVLRMFPRDDFLGGITRADNFILGTELATSHLNSFETPAYSVNPYPLLQVRAPATTMNDHDGVAFGIRAEMQYTPIFPEWDLSITGFWWQEFYGNGPMSSGWSSGLQGKGDRHAQLQTTFTYRQNLEMGLTYGFYPGKFDLQASTMRPWADRNYIAFNGTYHF